jgi:hypothetical protein
MLAWQQLERTLLVLGNETVLRLDLETGKWTVWRGTGFGPGHLARSKDKQTICLTYNFGSQHLLFTKERRVRPVGPTGATWWISDDRRMFIDKGPSAQGYDIVTDFRLGTLISNMDGDSWLMIGPSGHYRGSNGIEKQIVYVAQHDDGSLKTYTPGEFSTRFGWRNEPDNAMFMKVLR